MTKVSRAKIDQIEKCRKFLVAKRGKMLGEATRHPVWGIGIPIRSPGVLNKHMWTGKNLLGKIYDDILKSIPV